MSDTMNSPLTDALIKTRHFFTRNQPVSADGRTLLKIGGRSGDSFYRDRWSHDKVVRSTHGVNCTGSCSWNVYVKDGIITWETQAVDYPTTGPDKPEYEPRGCPRGASFSWYTYSPTRTRYPSIRGVLLEMYREAKSRLKDPVLAWADVTEDPERSGPAARVAWCAHPGTRPSRSSLPRTCTRFAGGGPTGLQDFRPSRRCRWFRTLRERGSSTSSAGRC